MRSLFTRIPLVAMLALVMALGGIAVAHAQGDDAQDPPSETDDDTSEADDEGSEGESESDEASEADDEGSEPDDDASEDDDGEDDSDDDRGPVMGARVYGPDRITTAVAISQYEFRGGAAEVYLARADNFADAVAAGALKRGPVLLVPTCGELPAVVAEEIGRLHPHRVVALGGPGAICEEMLDQAIQAAEAARGPGGDDDDSDDADDNGDDDARTEEVQRVEMAVGEERTFQAGEAGQVTIRRIENGVELVEAVAVDDTWTVQVDDDEPGEVEVDFRNPTTKVEFNAELEDGQVRVRVRTRLR